MCERSLHLSHPLTPTLVRATRQAAGSGSAQLRAAGRAGRMVALLVAVLLAAGGCAAPKRTFEPDQDHNTLDEMAFIHYLATLPNVTVDEGYHAVLLLDPEAGAATRFAEREAALVNRGAVRRSWRLEPDDLLDAGTLAHMLAKVCEAEGGVNDLLWGSWGLGDRRYALRTARWHELMPYNVPYRTVSGGEVLAAVTRAAEFIERSEGEPG